MAKKSQSPKRLLEEDQELRARLEELEETLRAIQNGEVDALVVTGQQGEQVYTLKDANEPYRVLIETMSEGTATVAPDGGVLYSNNRLAAMLRIPLEDIIGTPMRLHIAEPDRPMFDGLLKKGLQTECQGEFSLIAGDGTLPVQLSLSPLHTGGMDYIVAVITDLTEQKKSEEALRKSNRALKMLSTCNEALIRAREEADLLDNVCRIITEVGGYNLAWVGFAEHDGGKSVRPVSQSGFDEGYLDEAKITWADTERGRGPTGKAIRTGEAVVARDIDSEPDFLPWRDEALRHGYSSSIALPLIADGQDPEVLGAIAIYSSEKDAFNEEEIKILSELASDLSYGISTLRAREERRRVDAMLCQSEAELKEAQRVANVGSWELDWKKGTVTWSEEIYRIFRRDPALPAPTFSEHSQFLTSSSKSRLDSAIDMTLRTGEPFEADLELIRPDGTTGWITARGEIKSKDTVSTLLRGTALDITKRKEAEEALELSEAELHDAYFAEATINMILSESLQDMPFEEFLQKALNMTLSVPWIAFESTGSIALVEDEADVLVMKAQSNLDEPSKRLCARVPFGKCLCGKAAQSQNIEFTGHVDERYEVCYKGIPPHGQYSVPLLFSGKTLGVLNIYVKEGHIRDKKEEEFLRTVADTLAGIIMRKKAEKRIEYLAYYDGLTSLPNRKLFVDRLKQGVARAEAASKIVAVLITDIDRFKAINETYGTEVADTVLKEVAERLSAAVRKGDTLARLGNDEFGIALLDIASADDIIQLMEKIMKYISYPLEVDNNEIILTFSTGIAIYPQDNKDPSDLLTSAGLALGIAKKEGRQTYKFYAEDFNVKASEFMLVEKNLYHAVKNEEFLLHYQPYWEMNTQKIGGIEALLRWQSKDMGLVSPGMFIPVLEETGMIIEVGEWILEAAMRQLKEWQNKGYSSVPISVNLSLVQFRQKDLAEMVQRIIRDLNFDPSLLTLEITESAFMQDIELTNSVLKKLKDIGVSVSIDDFGTGYSSLSYLKRLPIDNLKIDISFIREIVTDPDSASIVLAIINMAHTLQLKTIAEGIETEEQWKFLRLFRCDMGQGFYLCKPLPAVDIEKMFEAPLSV